LEGESKHTDDTVLGDLLVCLLAQKQMMMVHSDLELCKGYELFKQMYEADPKCHEALFGLGRINYIQGRYEIAEKLFIKAYEAKRDMVYRVWLGYA
jgi:tetratricopeptide (TPR) repeat protein